MEIETKYGEIKIFAKTLEDEALLQITGFANSILGKDAHIRIMPDAHAGKGCVIGTTMVITDKVCPNLVGVDIGCGVDLIKTDIDFKSRVEELDRVIRSVVPFGRNHHMEVKTYRDFAKLKCWNEFKKEIKDTAVRSLGTLGGGNHFIEAYENGYLSVHSGSRNIGYKVAWHYQRLAEKQMAECERELRQKAVLEVPEKERAEWYKKHKIEIDSSLAYLTGELMKDYLHDMNIMQEFAVANRKAMFDAVVDGMGGKIEKHISSTHNYIDMSDKKIILRKGAISARKGESLVIPLNMRDGVLICEGKGNADWNYSAPHGAGRLYSRSKAKEIFGLEQYKKSMAGIFSSCINEETIDEAPFCYKEAAEIMECIKPTVEINEWLKPIYNFKASE